MTAILHHRCQGPEASPRLWQTQKGSTEALTARCCPDRFFSVHLKLSQGLWCCWLFSNCSLKKKMFSQNTFFSLCYGQICWTLQDSIGFCRKRRDTASSWDSERNSKSKSEDNLHVILNSLRSFMSSTSVMFIHLDTQCQSPIIFHFRLVWAVALFTHYANHSVNFFLYILTGSEFRQELKQSLLDVLRVCGISTNTTQIRGGSTTESTTVDKNVARVQSAPEPTVPTRC